MSEPAKKRTRKAATPAIAAARAEQHHQSGRKDKPGNAQSKQSRVIAMLRSPPGATIDAIMKITGWQQHSVRGFLSGVVRKRLKLKLSSEKVDGNRVYQIKSGDSGKATVRAAQPRPA
jgi:hypothetical protein